MSLLLDLIFSATGPLTVRRFRDQCSKPIDTQFRLLNHIIRKNSETAFGKAHRFSSIKSFEDFQKTVPISNYDDLSPYIDASLRGEAAQLTAEKPILFAATSGTTGASKYIPVTPESRSAKSQLMRVWLSALYRDYPNVFSGRIFSVVSPEVESYAPCGTPCGAESGHGYRNMPRALKAIYSCPYEIYELKDYDTKYYCLLRIAAGQRVHMIYACNPSTVLLLAERLGRFTEHILRDVRDGTFSSDFEIPSKLRTFLCDQMRADPARAAFLERAASKEDGKLLPKHVWPDMIMISCWKGGTVGMYVDRFRRYFASDIPVRDIGYFASEHRGSVPMSDEGADGVLAVPTNLYEFYPADEDREPEGTGLLSADQLEVGKRYFIYVTTLAGLYRYDMNDIVEVSGFYQRTPLIHFVQKGKGVVSFTGEKLYETQVLASVEEAFAPRAGHYEFIAAVGELRDGNPRYVFLVEFDGGVSDREGREMLVALETALRQHNIEYASKRDSLRLDAPVLRIVRHGGFDNYRRRMVQKGRSDGQFKILRLTSDVSFAEEFEVERHVEAEVSN